MDQIRLSVGVFVSLSFRHNNYYDLVEFWHGIGGNSTTVASFPEFLLQKTGVFSETWSLVTQFQVLEFIGAVKIHCVEVRTRLFTKGKTTQGSCCQSMPHSVTFLKSKLNSVKVWLLATIRAVITETLGFIHIPLGFRWIQHCCQKESLV